MKVDPKQVVTTTKEALNDLKQLDATNWSKTEKLEVLESVEEVIKLGLLAKWKVQKTYFDNFVKELDTKIQTLDIQVLEQTTDNLDTILSNIKQVEIAIKKAS